MARAPMTSSDNPLRIAEIPIGSAGGMIGVTFAPGKQQRGAYSGSHQRDLRADLDRVVAWNAAAVVTLVEAHELETLGIQHLGEEVRRRHMDWYHWPIKDYGVPDTLFEAAWPTRSAQLRSLIAGGGRVLIHCKGGLGRAGTISARLLVESGIEPKEAMAAVRAVRPGAIENEKQELWVARGRTAPLDLQNPAPVIASHPGLTGATGNAVEKDSNMDWFQKITGFKETSYDTTRQKFELLEGQLRSRVNNRIFSIGTLRLSSLSELREHVASIQCRRGKLSFRNIVGDVRAMHQREEFDGALFQVASQFNMLEMVGPGVTPEQGVTRYQNDRTQGPACAIAAGAATIYRNYFALVDGQRGQTSSRQLDGLADLGFALAGKLQKPADWLWSMQNGYALCTTESLRAISSHLNKASEHDRDNLRSLLRIGVHSDVEVTEGNATPPRTVSQAFCSALPVAYSDTQKSLWKPFAYLVLEAAYEATLLTAATNAARGRSNIVLLTQLGGGAFGNDGGWIDVAMKRALTIMQDYDLDVRLVSYNLVPPSMIELERAFG